MGPLAVEPRRPLQGELPPSKAPLFPCARPTAALSLLMLHSRSFASCFSLPASQFKPMRPACVAQRTADGGLPAGDHACLPALQYRWHVFKSIRAAIDQNEGGLDNFTQGGCLKG